MLTVCGFVIFFSAVLETALGRFEETIPKTAAALIYGFFELTHGAGFAAANLEKPLSVLFISALSGWSGVSVYMQVSAFSRKHGLSLKKYILAKAVMALICPAYTFVIGKIFAWI